MNTPDTSYREIPLTKGQSALVDADDIHLVQGIKWNVFGGRVNRYYARTGGKDGVAMHRVIMGLRKGDVREVDHINGNTLDNRRANLRICSHAENVCNRRLNSNSTSGYKGVTYSKGKKVWQAQISVAGKRKHLGYFPDAKIAHDAYRVAAEKNFGQFARLA